MAAQPSPEDIVAAEQVKQFMEQALNLADLCPDVIRILKRHGYSVEALALQNASRSVVQTLHKLAE